MKELAWGTSRSLLECLENCGINFNYSIYFNCVPFMNMPGGHLKRLYPDRKVCL